MLNFPRRPSDCASCARQSALLIPNNRTGRILCYHLDLYRLENPEQVLAAGLEQYFRPEEAVTLIEWFDRTQGTIPTSDRLIVVHIDANASRSEFERTIGYEDPRT